MASAPSIHIRAPLPVATPLTLFVLFTKGHEHVEMDRWQSQFSIQCKHSFVPFLEH